MRFLLNQQKLSPMMQRNSVFYSLPSCGVMVFLALFLVSNAVINKIQKDRYWTDGLRVEGIVVAVHTDTRTVTHNMRRVVNEVIEFEYRIDDQVFDDSQSFYFDTAYFIGQRIPIMSQPHEPWTATIILDDPFNLKTYAPLAFGCGLMTLIGMRLYHMGDLFNRRKNKEFVDEPERSKKKRLMVDTRISDDQTTL